MYNMQEQETFDVRLAAFFLDMLTEKLKPIFENRLEFSCLFELNLNGSKQDFMAIIEQVPNPEFGKPPCYFQKPVVMLQQQHADGRFVLSATNKIWNNTKVRSMLKELKNDFEERDGLCLSTFLLKL